MGDRINYDKLASEVSRHGSQPVRAALIESFGGDPNDKYVPLKSGVPDNFDIGRLMESFMGREFRDCFDPKRGTGRVPIMEADGAAVAYSDFTGISGQVFFTEVNAGYDMEKDEISEAVESKATVIIDMEKIPGISMPSDEFVVIGEGEDYPNFGVSQDYQHRAALEKRGGIIQVTKEAIAGDKTGILLPKCKALGKMLYQNKKKRIIDAIIDENTGAKSAVQGGHRYHWLDTSYGTYQAATPYVNLVTSNGLLDFTNVNNAWLKLKAMKDPYSGEPIEIKIKHLIVTPTNSMTALRIKHTLDVRMHSGGYATSGNLVDTRSESPLKEVIGDFKILTSQLLATRSALQTDWWLGNVTEAIRYAYLWDITTEDAPSYTDQAFRRDVIFQHKVGEFGRAWTKDPRQLCENNA